MILALAKKALHGLLYLSLAWAWVAFFGVIVYPSLYTAKHSSWAENAPINEVLAEGESRLEMDPFEKGSADEDVRMHALGAVNAKSEQISDFWAEKAWNSGIAIFILWLLLPMVIWDQKDAQKFRSRIQDS